MSRSAVLLVAGLATVAFCASIIPAVSGDAPGLVDRWKSATGVPPGLRKVLVVGIVRDPKTRRTFEDRFVTLLRARGVEAITSYSIVPDLAAGRDTAEVLGALFAQRVEGLITVRLRPLDDAPEEQRAAAWHTAMDGTERPRAYVESALGAMATEADDYGAEAVYWSVDNGRRIWAGRFPGASAKRLRKDASAMVQTVIDEMRFVGLY
jgi:hypothetical protein